MNYLRSEWYRVMRLKSLYLLCGVWVIVFSLAVRVLVNAPAGQVTQENYGSVLITIGAISGFFLALLVSHTLTGKNLNTLKQTISFGISKLNIYVIKFCLSLLVFLIVLTLLLAAGFAIGQYYFTDGIQQIDFIQTRVVNVLPLLISSLALCQWLNFLKINGVMNALIIFFLYLMSSDVIQIFDRLIFKKDVLTNYFPSALLMTAIDSDHFEVDGILIGIVLTLVFLILGIKQFNRRDVA